MKVTYDIIKIVVTICMLMGIIGIPIQWLYSLIIRKYIPVKLWLLVPGTIGMIVWYSWRMIEPSNKWYTCMYYTIVAVMWGLWALTEYSTRGKEKDIAMIRVRWQIMRELDIDQYPVDIQEAGWDSYILPKINELEIAEINDKLKYW